MYAAKFISLLFESGRVILGLEYHPAHKGHAAIPDNVDISDLSYPEIMAEVDSRLSKLNAKAPTLEKLSELVGSTTLVRATEKPVETVVEVSETTGDAETEPEGETTGDAET